MYIEYINIIKIILNYFKIRQSFQMSIIIKQCLIRLRQSTSIEEKSDQIKGNRLRLIADPRLVWINANAGYVFYCIVIHSIVLLFIILYCYSFYCIVILI